jgi:hypothetical protein
MAFWDKTDDATKANGVPTTFTNSPPDGKLIPNALHSYTFQAPINDHLDPDFSVHLDANYSMSVGY